MNKIFLFILFATILVFPGLTYADGPYLNIPPTNAFDTIDTPDNNSKVHAVNFSMPLIMQGDNGVSVKSSNKTHTVIISGFGNCSAIAVNDETTNRNYNTTYHNTSGKTMLINVSFFMSPASTKISNVQGYIGTSSPPTTFIGEAYILNSVNDAVQNVGSFSFVVPNNYYYKIIDVSDVGANPAIDAWIENLDPTCGSIVTTGTYKQTLANNTPINTGGNRTNYINGTGNPVHVINDPTRNQVNVTVSLSGTGTNQGTYNQTLANNVLINSGGQKINFINGSSISNHIQNSNSGTQVNVTTSLLFNNKTKTSSYNILNSDDVIYANATSSAFSLTLPDASTNIAKWYEIKKIDSALANIVTIQTTSSQTIDGLPNYNMTLRGETLILASDGSRWNVLSHDPTPNISSYMAKGSTLNFWYGSFGTSFAPTTLSLSNCCLIANPFIVSKIMTFDRISMEVTTLQASSTCRMGIYYDNGNDYPGKIVIGSDVGTVLSNSTGVKSNTFSPTITLQPGLYWLAGQCSNSATGVRAIPIAAIQPVLGMSSAMGATNTLTGWSINRLYGALPSTFPGGASIVSAITEEILLRTTG